MNLVRVETPAQGTGGATLAVLQLVGVRKTFGSFIAVEDINLDIYNGEFLTVVGPSGSGKTTLLRMLAGMERPTAGNITLRGTLINEVPANKRPTCIVFQSLALFPHKTVGENIEFPLKVKKMPRAERKQRALELIRLMRLPESYYRKNVMTCSGGEKQRVALARALAYDPDILFFDEPLSALDYKLKKAMEKELKDLHRATGKTFVYITHSLEEAMVMSDRIAVMRAGHFVQVGTPDEIYSRPANRFVAEFIGDVNVFGVKKDANGGWVSEEDGSRIEIALPPALADASEAAVVVRPEFLRFIDEPSQANNAIKGTVYNEYALGSRIQYEVRSGNRTLVVELSRANAWTGGLDQPVIVGWDARDAIVVAG
jgi:spermidine/putrescine transport system ATP-binding protein